MQKFIKNYLVILIGLSVGASGGYFYWKFSGCTGSCPITSSPLNSILYGAVTGGLLFSLFTKSKKKAV